MKITNSLLKRIIKEEFESAAKDMGLPLLAERVMGWHDIPLDVGDRPEAEEEQKSGCTDPEAKNYDPEATADDDSCEYDKPPEEPEEPEEPKPPTEEPEEKKECWIDGWLGMFVDGEPCAEENVEAEGGALDWAKELIADLILSRLLISPYGFLGVTIINIVRNIEFCDLRKYFCEDACEELVELIMTGLMNTIQQVIMKSKVGADVGKKTPPPIDWKKAKKKPGRAPGLEDWGAWLEYYIIDKTLQKIKDKLTEVICGIFSDKEKSLEDLENLEDPDWSNEPEWKGAWKWIVDVNMKWNPFWIAPAWMWRSLFEIADLIEDPLDTKEGKEVEAVRAHPLERLLKLRDTEEEED